MDLHSHQPIKNIFIILCAPPRGAKEDAYELITLEIIVKPRETEALQSPTISALYSDSFVCAFLIEELSKMESSQRSKVTCSQQKGPIVLDQTRINQGDANAM